MRKPKTKWWYYNGSYNAIKEANEKSYNNREIN